MGEHVQFAQDFRAGQQQGLIYPRWLPHANLGYGAPAFVFYPPLATALVATISGFGMHLFPAFKVAITLLTLGAAISAAGLGRRVATAPGPATPLLVGALWVLLPYHGLDIYSRFALAELATFCFIPLLFASLESWRQRSLTRASISYGLTCLAHLPTAFLAAWMAMGWDVSRRRNPFRRTLPALALGAALAAVYLLPSVLERPSIHADWLESNPHYRFDAHYLLFPATVSVENDPVHGSYSGPIQSPSLSRVRQIAPVTLALAIAAWLARQWMRRRQPGLDPLHRYLVVAAVSTLGMTRLAHPIWQWIPGFASVVFPWRLTLFLTLAAAVLAGSTLPLVLRRQRIRLLPLLLLPLLASLALTWNIQARADWDSFTVAHAGTPVVRLRVAGALMPRSNLHMRGFRQQPFAGPPRLIDEQGSPAGSVSVLRRDNQHHLYAADVSADAQGGLLHVSQFDYPGWQATVDGRPTPHHAQQPLGTLQIPLPPGRHQVELTFASTWQRRLGMAVSILAILLLAALTGRRLRRTIAARSAP